jgi:hypothetical protein
MVLLSVSCEMGLGVKAGAACVGVGASETESMANAFLVVVKTGGVILCIAGRPSNLDPPVIIIRPLNILCPRTLSFSL